MADGRQKYDTKEVVVFSGLNASVDPTKDLFPDSDSPYTKNFFNPDGILDARKGRTRINATRFNNEITSLVNYKDRSNVTHLVFSVKTVAVDPNAPDGLIQESS